MSSVSVSTDKEDMMTLDKLFNRIGTVFGVLVILDLLVLAIYWLIKLNIWMLT